jgi:hypothetical protein
LVLQGRGLWQIASSYLFGVGFFLLLIGGLFMLQSWPYGHEMQTVAYIAMPFMTVSALIMLLVNYKNLQWRNFTIHILVRIVALGLLGLLYGSFLLIVYKLIKPQVFKEN